MRIPNLEYLIKKIKDLLGTTSISSIGDGTVTGAISSQSDQIGDLGPYNGLDSDSTVAALSAAQGKALSALTVSRNKLTVQYVSNPYVQESNLGISCWRVGMSYHIMINTYLSTAAPSDWVHIGTIVDYLAAINLYSQVSFGSAGLYFRITDTGGIYIANAYGTYAGWARDSFSNGVWR